MVLKSWLHSGWRGGLKILGLVAGTALATVVGLVVTGVWKDLTENDALAITLDSGGAYGQSLGAVVPRAVSQLPPPPEVGEVTGAVHRCATRGWIRKLGGVETETVFTLYVEGLSDRTVVLDRVEADVLKRRPPMRGVFVRPCVDPLGESVRTLSVDLDSVPARVTYTAPKRRWSPTGLALGPNPSRPRKFLFSLTRGEVEAFQVFAIGGRCWCSWRLRLGYTVAGERHTVVVDDGGDPFETTGSSRAREAG